MRLLWWLLAGSLLAPAQEVVWVNLEGPWRYSDSDDPRHAAPDFDDRAWPTRQVPFNFGVGAPAARNRTFWLRRTVSLTIPPRPLALTIGVLRPAYEVYVNGVQIGATGPLDVDHAEIPRPRTFAIPAALVGRKLTIALRARSPHSGGSGAWGDTHGGPWLLSDPAAVPTDAARLTVLAQKLGNGLDVAQAPVMLCFGAIALFVWVRARRQLDFLWMGVLLVLSGLIRLHTYAQIDLDSRPWVAGRHYAWIAGFIPVALMTAFAAATLGVRGYSRLIWALTAAGTLSWLLAPGRPEFHWIMWALEALTLWILARGVQQEQADSNWRGGSRWAVAAGVIVMGYFHGSRWAGWNVPIQGGNTVRFENYTLSLPPALVTLAALAFTAVMVARLLRDREERLRLSNELAAARVVQQLLLNVEEPSQTEYAITAVYEPAQEVGGDFYQTLTLDGGGVLVAVGDVSGKGLKAAMVVSMVVGVLRSHRHLGPADLLGEMNRVLVGSLDGGFVTCLVLRLDAGGQARVANAGHLAPYVNGREIELTNGLPLGLAAGMDFDDTRFVLAPGAPLTLVSDGVIEAENAQRELFGFERTREISTRSAPEIAAAAQAWGQNDDITVVTVRRSPST